MFNSVSSGVVTTVCALELVVKQFCESLFLFSLSKGKYDERPGNYVAIVPYLFQ